MIHPVASEPSGVGEMGPLATGAVPDTRADAPGFLEVRGLTVRFGGLVAVNDFSMSVARGRVHALIGPNGAGKSTTFNCISRYYEPSAGTIILDAEEITGRRPHEMASLGVARTFQNLELFSELTVLENVLMGTHARHATSLRERSDEPAPAAIVPVTYPKDRRSAGSAKAIEPPAPQWPTVSGFGPKSSRGGSDNSKPCP